MQSRNHLVQSTSGNQSDSPIAVLYFLRNGWTTVLKLGSLVAIRIVHLCYFSLCVISLLLTELIPDCSGRILASNTGQQIPCFDRCQS